MSHIEDIARNAMITAHSDLVKARRLLLVVAGLLALTHMLTIYPYLHVFQEIPQIEPRLKTDDRLLTQLDSEINRLRTAEQNASQRITDIVTDATGEMIDQFARLDRLVEEVRSTDRSAIDILHHEWRSLSAYHNAVPGTSSSPPIFAAQTATLPDFVDLGPNPALWPDRTEPFPDTELLQALDALHANASDAD
jgi:hypothetical protein